MLKYKLNWSKAKYIYCRESDTTIEQRHREPIKQTDAPLIFGGASVKNDRTNSPLENFMLYFLNKSKSGHRALLP